MDGNGSWSDNEPYIATGVTTAGNYLFEGLSVGSYLVRVTDARYALRRFTVSVPGPLATAGVDNQNQRQPYAIALSPGAVDTTADFGYREYQALGASNPANPGMIGDLIWLDADADGQYNPKNGDLPLPGVTVEARTPDGVIAATASTGPDGQYLFADLAQGSYLVRVTDALGALAAYIPTAPSPAASQDNTNRAQPYTVTLGMDSVSMTADFGYTRPATIGGFVFYDQNHNQVQDADEILSPKGVQVTLVGLIPPSGPITTTAMGGVYVFTRLVPGAYRVSVPSMVGGALLTSEQVVTVTTGFGGAGPEVSFGFVSPTASDLAAFTAEPAANGIILQWTVLSEPDVEGYMVWRARSPEGPYKPVSQIIAATRDPLGASYQWLDESAERGGIYWYRLEQRPGGRIFGPIISWPGDRAGRIYIPLLLR